MREDVGRASQTEGCWSELTKGHRKKQVLSTPQSQKRLYTRYPFSASATVADDSSVEIPAQVVNIGAGGCRLVSSTQFSVGTRVTVRIRRDKAYFEAPANVAHSAEDGMGLMFHNESTESLRVLVKWLQQAKESIAAIQDGNQTER